ncbi:hypothetical protein PS874_00875 [Pseudomonas fluorescens]|nr:hypothetical protein PS874_00875 [Pseudomonas fluorescens]
MSPKPPPKGPISVDIHPRPRQPSDGHTPLPDTLPRVDFGSPATTNLQNPSRTTGTPGDGDLDAITPAPTVTASDLPSVPVPAPAAAPRSLERYWVASAAQLPAPDAQGIRTLKGRQYVDVPGGGIVHVEADPDTGLYLYRAKLPRELQASGPVLVRDPSGTLWHPVDEIGSTTYPFEAQVLFHRRIAERALVKSYFAEATDQHADDFIAHFGDKDKAEAELKRLQLGFPHLDQEVRAWERAYKGIDDGERIRRLAIGAKVRRLYKWQGETLEKVHRDGRLVGFKLDLDLGNRKNQTLPIFSTRAYSIVSLNLQGSAVQKLGGLIAGFAHIETLKIRIYGTTIELPVEIERLTALRVLNMSETRLTLGPGDVERLTNLPRLQELNLEKCNLQLAPSVRGMTELRVLMLGDNGISDLPAGLSQLPGPSRLHVLDLHRNRNIRAAPDISGMSELRVLDLRDTGINQLPVGLGSADGPLRLEVLKLGDNRIWVAPSLRGMTALRELDLGNTGIDRFPEGITSEIPKTNLDLSNNDIASIPEHIEIRKGFELRFNPITDPSTLRRLIFARRQTGTDIWLGTGDADLTVNLWLRNVPQDQIPDKLTLWDSVFPVSEGPLAPNKMKIRELSRTPEFQVERQILQRRVWAFLERFAEADQDERVQLTQILRNEPSPGQMLDKLEEELRKYDAGRQNQPPHHLPKRPRLD